MLPVAPFFWDAAHAVAVGAVDHGWCAGEHWALHADCGASPCAGIGWSSFIYSQLVWVVVLGYTVFGDVPDGYTLVGAAIVIGSGLYILHRERRRGARIARGE